MDRVAGVVFLTLALMERWVQTGMMGGGMEGRKCRWRRRDREVRLQLWGVECKFEGEFCFKRPGGERVFEGRQDRPVEGEL